MNNKTHEFPGGIYIHTRSDTKQLLKTITSKRDKFIEIIKFKKYNGIIHHCKVQSDYLNNGTGLDPICNEVSNALIMFEIVEHFSDDISICRREINKLLRRNCSISFLVVPHKNIGRFETFNMLITPSNNSLDYIEHNIILNYKMKEFNKTINRYTVARKYKIMTAKSKQFYKKNQSKLRICRKFNSAEIDHVNIGEIFIDLDYQP